MAWHPNRDWLALGLLLLFLGFLIEMKLTGKEPYPNKPVNPNQYSSPIGPPAPIKPVRVIDVKTTGYSNWEHCPSCTDYRHGLTASGTVARRGTCATDPQSIRLGTLLYIPGYGPCWATDTGSAVKGNILDLYFDSEQEAIAWGVQTVRAKILGWEKP